MSGCGNIEHQFKAVTHSNSKITIDQINQWFTDAKLNKKITPEDTKLCFEKFKAETIDLTSFVKFLQDLSEQKKLPVGELEEKLASCELLTGGGTVANNTVGKKITDAMQSVVEDGHKPSKRTCKRMK
ncbi:TPPP family protein CG45057-like Protein [Tribolium castaneum]|uniref:TPPP family protein CG45057-like Protein n=1 Tax=Tribolium castaneum TaxID=7070 RepID=D6WZZ8_TRICA|nr:TPPP family protein CG45057-like Protein [Tribolium castaneum]